VVYVLVLFVYTNTCSEVFGKLQYEDIEKDKLLLSKYKIIQVYQFLASKDDNDEKGKSFFIFLFVLTYISIFNHPILPIYKFMFRLATDFGIFR